MNLFARLYRFSLRYPRRVLVIAALLTLVIAPGVFRLTLRTDGLALVPSNAPAVIFDRSIRDTFAVEDPIVVVIHSGDDGGIFNARTLALIRDLSESFLHIDGLRPGDVFSLSTEHVDRVFPGTFSFRTFLDPLPETPEDLFRLRGDIDAVGLYRGTLISFDEEATAIFVSMPQGRSRVGMYRRIQDVIAARGPTPEEIHIIGAPVAEALLGNHILEDLGAPEAVVGRRLDATIAVPAGHIPGRFERARAFVAGHFGLLPASIVIMTIVFLSSFRSLVATGLALVKIGTCLVLVFGLMGWFGVPIYLTIAVLPVMLVATGVSDEIHLFTRYARELRERPDKGHLEALTTTFEELWEPVVKTSVTTAIGFLSFAASPLGAVRAFGIFTGVGTMICIFWALTVTPACAAMIDPKRFAVPGLPGTIPPGERRSLFIRLGALVSEHPRKVLCIAALLGVVSVAGASRIEVQDSWLAGFAPTSELYRETQRFNEQFLGTHILLVSVEPADRPLIGNVPEGDVNHREITLPRGVAGDAAALAKRRVALWRAGKPNKIWESTITAATLREGRITITFPSGSSPRFVLSPSPGEALLYEIAAQPFVQPEAIDRIGGLETFIEERRQDAVGGVLGPAKYLATTNFLLTARREGARNVPRDPERIRELWSSYKMVRGDRRLQQLVDAGRSKGILTVFLKDANFVATQRLMDAIRQYERTELLPHGLAVGFAGDVAVSQTLIEGIVSTQVRSLLLSLVGVLLVTALLGRSLRWGLLCMMPCASAVLMNFGLMGWLGTPLGVATSMFASMTVGIGVDYAIHLLDRYRLESSSGLDPRAALLRSMAITGPAIFTDALGVSLGFGILLFSQVPANAHIGARVSISILGCLAGTLIFLPALLTLVGLQVVRKPTI